MARPAPAEPQICGRRVKNPRSAKLRLRAGPWGLDMYNPTQWRLSLVGYNPHKPCLILSNSYPCSVGSGHGTHHLWTGSRPQSRTPKWIARSQTTCHSIDKIRSTHPADAIPRRQCHRLENPEWPSDTLSEVAGQTGSVICSSSAKVRLRQGLS